MASLDQNAVTCATAPRQIPGLATSFAYHLNSPDSSAELDNCPDG
jgi:hypothetical protein